MFVAKESEIDRICQKFRGTPYMRFKFDVSAAISKIIESFRPDENKLMSKKKRRT